MSDPLLFILPMWRSLFRGIVYIRDKAELIHKWSSSMVAIFRLRTLSMNIRKEGFLFHMQQKHYQLMENSVICLMFALVFFPRRFNGWKVVLCSVVGGPSFYNSCSSMGKPKRTACFFLSIMHLDVLLHSTTTMQVLSPILVEVLLPWSKRIIIW